MYTLTTKILAVFTTVVLLSGCYKYKEQPQLQKPAYLRVFNSIPFTLDAFHAGQAEPFLCFIIDPHFDGSGAPDTGAVVGDWLHNRELFSLSYAADAGTALDAQAITNLNDPNLPTQTVPNANYEYPGKLHVLTAPQMNGLDLSAWAQVPSGKHRVLFVVRPEDNTPFSKVAPSLKKILIDTTLDLSAGEVYTINALSTDIDNNGYGVFLRQEQFIHEKFDTGRIYASFYNLSGIRPYLATDPKFPDFWFAADTMAINYTYWVNDDNYATNVSMPSQPLSSANNVYFSTIIRGQTDGSVFVPLPFLTRDQFFDQQGVLRTLSSLIPGNTPTGTMPYVSFSFNQTSAQVAQYGHFPTLVCSGDPANFNTLDPNSVNNSLGQPFSGPSSSLMYQPNLNRVIQANGSLNIIPTINVFEIIYNHIYLMQLQRGFDKVPE
jgi:hypothetical protein